MKDTSTDQAGSGKLMKYGMWACCAVMVLPIVAYLVAGAATGASGSLIIFAPLLLCVGAHVVMHRYMGKSCHGKASDADATPQVPDPRAAARIAAE